MTLHTDRHFEGELQTLQQLLLRMGGLVEQQIARAIEALVERDSDLAREVITRDREVNQLDILVDEECLKLIALHQPAASDLRLVTTAMKIDTDLERIGDMAVNICERVLELNEEPTLKPYIDIPRMAKEAQGMVRDSLDAFVQRRHRPRGRRDRSGRLGRRPRASGLPRAAVLHGGGSAHDRASDRASC